MNNMPADISPRTRETLHCLGIDPDDTPENIAAVLNNTVVRGLDDNSYKAGQLLNVYIAVNEMLGWPLSEEARGALTKLEAVIEVTYTEKHRRKVRNTVWGILLALALFLTVWTLAAYYIAEKYYS